MKAKNTVSDTVAVERVNTFEFVSKNFWLPLIFGASLIYMGNPAHAAQQQWTGKQSMQSGSNSGGQTMQSGSVTRSQSMRPRNVIGTPPTPPQTTADSQSMQSQSMQNQTGKSVTPHASGDQNPGRGTKPPTDYTGTRSGEGGRAMEHGSSTIGQQMNTGMDSTSGASSGSGTATGAGSGTTGGTTSDTQQMNRGGAPDVNKGTTPNTNKETLPGSSPMNTTPSEQEMNKNPSSGTENLNQDTVSPGGDNMMRGTIPGGSNRRD